MLPHLEEKAKETGCIIEKLNIVRGFFDTPKIMSWKKYLINSVTVFIIIIHFTVNI